MALTEVLKIVAEDRASHVVDGIANRLQYQFGYSAKNAERLGKAISGYVTESLVGMSRIGIQSFAAMSAAGVVAFGALTYKIIESQLAYDKWAQKMGGQSSPLLAGAQNLEASLDGAAAALARAVASATDLPGLLNSASSEVDKISTAIDSGAIGRYLDFLQNRAAPVLAQMGPAGSFAAGAIGLTTGARMAMASGPEKESDGITRLGPISVPVRDPKTIEEDRQKALAAQIDAEIQAAEDLNEYKNALDQARFNKEIAERDKLRKKEREAIDQDNQDMLDRQEDQRRRAEQLDKETAEAQAHRDMNEAIARENREKAQARQLDIINATSEALQTVGSNWRTITDSTASAEDRARSYLNLIGGLSGLLNIFAPGLGTAVGGFTSAASSFFQDGGVARAANGMIVHGVGPGDRVPALLERGETIVPAGASHPTLIDEIVAAAGGGNARTSVTVNQGYLVPPTKTQTANMTRDSLVPALSDLQRNNRARIGNTKIRGTARGKRR